MRTLLGLVLCLPALGLNNAIVVHEAGGSAQNNRPLTLMMLFVEGEFPEGTFPKPRVNGVTPSAWQVDVKSRWPDGSILSAFVSLPVSLSANGQATVDFVPDASSCHLGSQATCEAAALDQNGMLNFLGGTWDAEIRGTANSIPYSANAKTMISGGAWRYWLRGPVLTRVIVEDPGFAYDFGWQWDGANWQAPSSDTYKSIHPLFELSFYPGWSAVEVGFRVENSWWTKLQNQKLNLEFLAGSPLSVVYSKTNYDLEAKAASSYYAWSGTAPGAIVIDRNLPYLVATRILPSYDTSIQLDAATLSSHLSRWPANVGTDDQGRPDPRSCTTQNPCAYIKTDMPGTGDHPNFGILPGFQLLYLYAMGNSSFSVATRLQAFERLVLGSADAAVTIPIHYRESRTAMTPSYRNYLDWPADPDTPSFGRIKSISAHPDGRTGSYDTTGPYPAQYICPNCPARTHSWLPDMYHWPSLYSLPYILTGRYSYLLSLQQAAAHWLGWDHPAYGRHYGFGVQYDSSNPRGPARALKEIFWAFLLSPDSPERNYFAGKLKNNDAAYEGVFNIRDGTYRDQVLSDCRGPEYVESFTTTISSTTTQKPNGQRKVFYISSNASNGINSITSLTVNGMAKTVGVYGQDTGKDWYYIPGARIVIQDSGAPPLVPTDTLYIAGTLHKSATPWCHGFAQLRWTENPIPMIGIGTTGMIENGGITGTSPWMVSYLAMHLGWARQTGALRVNGRRLFEYSAAKLGSAYIDGMLHPRKPVLYFGDYRMPLQDANGLITTWERFIAARNPPISLTQDISAGATSFTINCVNGSNGCVAVPSSEAIWKIDDEYIRTCGRSVSGGTTTFTVCPGGRGYWGTKAAAHTTASVVNAERRTMGDVLSGHTYPNLWVNALSTFHDVQATLGSGLEAYNRAIGMGKGLELRKTDQRYALVPRVEPYSLKVFVASGKAEIHYVAPTLAACRYAVTQTWFASSDDAGDELDRGGPRTRRLVFSPLAPGTYRYRVTCGAGRKNGTFTVPE
ncbi:MAG: hypothetical protein ACUVS7_03480 [Bryobacteraceae bacterium]